MHNEDVLVTCDWLMGNWLLVIGDIQITNFPLTNHH